MKKIGILITAMLLPLFVLGQSYSKLWNDVEQAQNKDLPKTALSGVPAQKMRRVIIAYEPVWAIGTGRTATPSDIAGAHALCREIMRSIAGDEAFSIPLLYGGSVKASNAGEILLLDNVDGVLVGGASLEAEQFSKIITA